MKINHDELKSIYRKYLEENKPGQRNNCPSADDMLHLVRSKLSTRQKKQILSHIQECTSCSSEVKVLMGILKEENNFIHRINDLQDKNNSRIKTKKSFLRPFHFSRKFISVPVTALVLLLALSFSLFLIFNEHNYRGKNKDVIEITNPKKKIIIYENTINLKWNAVPGTEFYEAVLFDQSLFPIWESDKLTTNSTILPPEAQKKLQDKATYFLLVTGTKKSGEKIESYLKEFKVFIKHLEN